MPYQIDFQPLGRRGKTPNNRSILDSAIEFGVELVNICGGTGTCGRCKVQVLSGAVSEPTSAELETLTAEELNRGYRLACQAYPASGLKIRVPPESLTTPQRTQVEGLEVHITPDPVLSCFLVDLEAPSIHNQEADVDRLVEAVEKRCHAD
ncbi:MAG: 2Fe-2S iron-sulfur cluster binding domain-containing protein, partial [Deltaproteobacteria bacterium]|nr:2Fe-2S iron-sulfur cluster binding domain-containing protein [Deltaproteobacteria bacterium]